MDLEVGIDDVPITAAPSLDLCRGVGTRKHTVRLVDFVRRKANEL